MIKFCTYLVSILCFVPNAFTQNINDQVLFTINDTPFFVNDFKKVYEKNIDLVIDQKQKDIDNYLDMYIVYKLKVLKAQNKGFDKGEAFLNELNTHRDELVKHYIYDSEISDILLAEAYERYNFEIKASHILFSLLPNASAHDTLVAYNKAISTRKKILGGDSFETVAVKISDDPSVNNNFGDLGYFTVFKMAYPFENAAYQTSVGDISMPIRTNFGYHIIKVVNKRANRGRVSVRHILINEEKENPQASYNKISEIYKSLLNGENFEQLAKNHSVDSYSATRGGLLEPFTSGDLTMEVFEDESFALNQPGELSKPFKTELGWHIIKLDYKITPESFDNMKAYLTRQIIKDSRSNKIEDIIVEKSKKRYSYNIKQANLNTLIKAIDVNIYNHQWKLNENNTLNNKTLLIINDDKVLNVNDFVKFMTLHTNNSTNFNPISKFVNNKFKDFIDKQLLIYYSDHLEDNNTEFKDIINEFSDGLLIFSLLEKEIWEKAATDSIGLNNFYLENKSKYIIPKRYKADILSTPSKKSADKIVKKLKKGNSLSEIKNKLSTNNIIILERSDIFEANDPALPIGIDETKVVNDPILQNNNYYIVKLNEVFPQKQLSFDEAKQKVISDYQQELENNWGYKLKNEFTVKIDQSVFNDVKSSLSKNQ